jgi:hypothetical protein
MKNYYYTPQMVAGNVKEFFQLTKATNATMADTYISTFQKLCERHGSRAFCVTYCSKVAC